MYAPSIKTLYRAGDLVTLRSNSEHTYIVQSNQQPGNPYVEVQRANKSSVIHEQFVAVYGGSTWGKK